ncbi:MAG: Spo0E family sporulation regulatory protein-aspartic acid phosphatase [Roseburia sp.]|nr:Spo0E family sporulation regulatory protein-aspartic acid phosphatase [Roseburia sp.]
MERMKQLQRKIESVRLELDEALLRRDKFESYYEKSTELDKLIEEYVERKEKVNIC